MNDWQPIETAPRDGTHILIAFGEDVVSVAAYHRSDDELHPWKFLDSQGSGLPFFNGARDDQYGPTQWQPLPKAPRPHHGAQSNIEMIERVARTLNSEVFDPEVLRVYGDLWAYDARDKALKQARAAIEAMREPTGFMKTSGLYSHALDEAESLNIEHVGEVWRAMIDEALK
jgi:hypothetical protein